MALSAVIHRKRFSWWRRLLEAPCLTLAKSLYAQRQRLLTEPPPDEHQGGIRLVCISDTHNSQPALPPGDILVHAGDLTQSGTAEELQAQLDWLNSHPHRHKVVIAGNHDIVLDRRQADNPSKTAHALDSFRWGSLFYLEHSSATLKMPGGRSLTVFGQPMTRQHGNWAFQYPAGLDVFTNQIPEDTDILITHGPPKFHLDVAGWGDSFLLRELWRVKPKVHVFGHIHEGYGQALLLYDQFERLYEQTSAGNAGILSLLYMLLLFIQLWATGRSPSVERTVLVNASAVGGLRDEKKRLAHVITV